MRGEAPHRESFKRPAGMFRLEVLMDAHTLAEKKETEVQLERFTKGEVLEMLTWTRLEIRAGRQVKLLRRLKYKFDLR